MNRWTRKNGATPSKLWIAQIGAMTEQQIRQGLLPVHGPLPGG